MMKFTTFPLNVGVEYTFVPNFNIGKLRNGKRFAYVAARALKAHPTLPARHRARIHEDCGAVECPSPVHSDSESLFDYWTKLLDAAQSNFLIPRFVEYCPLTLTPKKMFGTGGGHVHVDIPKGLTREERKLFVHNVRIDCTNRFYMNWLFQEWHENETLTHTLINYMREDCELDFRTENIGEATQRYRISPVVVRQRGNPYAQCRKQYRNTLEFRMFDAPRDAKMVGCNVDFALAYTLYIKELTLRGVRLELRRKDILNRSKLTAVQVEYRLKRLFSKLGLSWARYKKIYWDNYVTRAEHGKL